MEEIKQKDKILNKVLRRLGEKRALRSVIKKGSNMDLDRTHSAKTALHC